MDGVAAVVLAGGRGVRFGGGDKPGATVGGVPMLVRVLAATAGCAPRIVVGPRREGLPADVRCVREEPPGGGPVAALAAALPLVDTELLVLLAADLPALTVSAVEALATAVRVARPASTDGGHAGSPPRVVDGALLVDGDGRRQLLCGAWRVEALRGALGRLGEPAGQSMRRLTASLDVVEVRVGGAVWVDVDTPEDLDRAERATMADDGRDD